MDAPFFMTRNVLLTGTIRLFTCPFASGSSSGMKLAFGLLEYVSISMPPAHHGPRKMPAWPLTTGAFKSLRSANSLSISPAAYISCSLPSACFVSGKIEP